MLHEVEAEYVVFHVSDVTIQGVFTHQYTHSNQEIIDATIVLVNKLLDGKDYQFDFLMENLWWPGLTMADPVMTKRLLDGVHDPRKGIMLDTGHLMCANMNLNTPQEAWAYVDEMLDEHSGLCRFIKGIHLHESVSGAYAKAALKNVPTLAEGYYELQVSNCSERERKIELQRSMLSV